MDQFSVVLFLKKFSKCFCKRVLRPRHGRASTFLPTADPGKASPNKQTENNGRSRTNNEAIVFFTLYRMRLPCSDEPCGPAVIAPNDKPAPQRYPTVYFSCCDLQRHMKYLDLLECLEFTILTSFHTPTVVIGVMSGSLLAALCFTPGLGCAKFREL